MKKIALLTLSVSLLISSCGQNSPANTPTADASGTAQTGNPNSSNVGIMAVDGHEMKYIIGQLIVKDDKTGKLEKWLAKNNGKIIDRGDIPPAPATIDKKEIRAVVNEYRLVEAEGSKLTATSVDPQKLKGLSFQSQAAKETYMAGLSATDEGLESSLNYSMDPAAEGAVAGSYLLPQNLWHLNPWPGGNHLSLFDRGYDGIGVDVAVIDTGFYTNDNELTGYDPVSYTYSTWRPFPSTYDFEHNSYTLPDTADQAPNGARWHGLHVARTALGALNNHSAGVGTAPRARPMLFRISTSYSFWDAGRAVNTAVAWGADVINMSFGGWRASGWDGGANFGSALQTAANNGVINVASAGNDGAYSSKEVVFGNVFIPAAWNTVIGVGAIAPSGARASFSNYGPIAEIWAGGVSVGHSPSPDYSCWSAAQCSYINNGLYSNAGFAGTSAAAPVIAGVAATMKQANPNLRVWDVKRILQNTLNKKNGDWLLDATAAVRQTVIEKGGAW